MAGDPSVTQPGTSARGPKAGGFWTRRRTLTTLSVAGMLFVASVAGLAVYWGRTAGPDHDYVEVYVTDLPANFTKLEVRIAGVFVGEPNYSLALQSPSFDLLSLRGPDDALKIASGRIPAGDHHAIRIVFKSARALLNGDWIDLNIPHGMLTVNHDFNTKQNPSSAFLFDVNAEKSVQAEGSRLVFKPFVQSVYMHSYGKAGNSMERLGATDGSGADSSARFSGASKQQPGSQGLGEPDAKTRGDHPFTPPGEPSSSKFSWNPAPSKRATQEPTATTPSKSAGVVTDSFTSAATRTDQALPSPGDAASVPLDPKDIGGWFMQVKPAYGKTQQIVDLLNRVQADLVFTFGSVSAAYIFATPLQAKKLSEMDEVTYVEADRPIVATLASAKQAMRQPAVSDPIIGLKDAQGRPIDGRGVSAAVIDIGFDGTNLDIAHRLIDPVGYTLAANYKVESLFQADVPATDVVGGHGTHVLGILAGRGVFDPTQKGVAPGARVYGFSIGELSTTLWPNTALDWLVQNHAKVSPPIRLVSNSWGSGNAYDAQSLTTKLVQQLVAEGVVVVFAAGNAGGDGSIAATTSQCQIPTLGVICVAAYDDLNSGSRAGPVAPFSSRGSIQQPSSWPDISAPGVAIRSDRPLASLTGGLGVVDPYVEMSGTSMAAPMVSGVVALMLQANPGLSPARVESLIESTAFAYGASDYAAGGHYAKGHGLIDAYAAVAAAKVS
jgi:serine protease AprX